MRPARQQNRRANLFDDLFVIAGADLVTLRNGVFVAARPDGTGFVVTYYQDISYSLPAWKDPNPFKMDVYARVLGWQSGAISSVFLVPDTQAHGYYGYQGNPAVAVKSDGSFVITWESSWAGAGSFPPQSDPGMGIYARQFTATGTALGLDFHVNTTQDNDQSRPAIAMNGAGHFLIGWEGLDNTNNVDVYGQVYDF